MERVTSQIQNGKKIIIMDISGFSTAGQIQPVLNAAHAAVSSAGQKSALLLSDVTGAAYNKETTELAREFVNKNTPFMKGSAMVGVNGIQMILFQLLLRVSGRDIRLFKTRKEALDWLASLS